MSEFLLKLQNQVKEFNRLKLEKQMSNSEKEKNEVVSNVKTWLENAAKSGKTSASLCSAHGKRDKFFDRPVLPNKSWEILELVKAKLILLGVSYKLERRKHTKFYKRLLGVKGKGHRYWTLVAFW